MTKKRRTIKSTPFQFNTEKINPLFSKSKIYVMYHGKNVNLSKISKESVEKSLNTIKNIPIVGEFMESSSGEGNFGGHGGKLEISDKGIEFIQTTKAIGVIPESANLYWETIKDKKDIEREYLVVDGAYFWNRYEKEVSTLKEDNFGQSMEIEVTDGFWNDEEDLYEINEFIFSGLCILGIDKDGEGHVQPAFEDAKVITYSLNKESFEKEFSQMLSELKLVSTEEFTKKESGKMLKKLLEKYSLTIEDLTEKGLDFNSISEEELEAKIIEIFEIDVEDNPEDLEDVVENPQGDNPEDVEDNPEDEINKEEFEVLSKELKDLKEEYDSVKEELEILREFKLNAEKAEHKDKVDKLFSNFQLSDEDVKDLDIHKFTYEEIEEKCYAILGKKLATNKNFQKKVEDSVRVPLNPQSNDGSDDDGYGGLINKSKK